MLPGLSSRPLTLDDVPAWWRLEERAAAVDHPHSREGEASLRSRLVGEGFDAALQTAGGFDGDGELRAVGWVGRPKMAPKSERVCGGGGGSTTGGAAARLSSAEKAGRSGGKTAVIITVEAGTSAKSGRGGGTTARTSVRGRSATIGSTAATAGAG